ncbi:MAG TPA: LptA/OstA family protein [Thermoanaerobaculia bacterium]|nr:LptA/OstA family protein [Thermoanaerobaculia bacterium]
MPRRTASPLPGPRKPFRLLRWLLLVAAVGLVAAVVGLYLFGRSGRVRPAASPEGDRLAPQGEITMVGEGFEFTHTEGARRVFKIRGESVRADRAGTVFLEGVGLTLYDEEGQAYEVSSRSATFNRESREARLDGEVVLRGPGPTEIASEGVELRERGEVLLSTAPVAFRYQQLEGRAERMRVVRPENLYVLSGEVEVKSRSGVAPAASLVARQLVFERNRHHIRADGSVEIVRGDDRLNAHRVAAYLDEEDETMIFVRARGEVSGRMASRDGGGGRPVSFRAQSFSLLRDLEGVLQSGELEGSRDERVQIDAPTPEGTIQRLTAGFATVGFRDGQLASAEAFNGPWLAELAAGDGRKVLRALSGRRLQATFTAAGRLATMGADEAIDYRDERVHARGDSTRFDLATGKGHLTGDPVHLSTDRGEIYTPRADYDRNSGMIEAHEGVRALIEEAGELGLAGTPFAEGEGPVRVESREGFFREEPRGALFRGKVRAWQGKNLLLADELRADQAGSGQKLTASGAVRTVWVPEERPGRPAGPAGGGPLEVTARSLQYDEAEEELIYQGDVRAEQQDRVLDCRRLVVELTAEGEAERLTCSGDARLDDRVAGNKARGDVAVYDLVSRTVTMTGDPVRLEKADGATVAGGRVVYSLDTGTARVIQGPTTGSSEAAPPATPAPPGPGAEPR